MDFSCTFSFLARALSSFAFCLSRSLSVKISASGGNTNGFLVVSSFTVSLLEGEGEMGGRVVCLVSPEEEPGTPERKEPRGPEEYTNEMTCMRKLCFTAGLCSYKLTPEPVHLSTYYKKLYGSAHPISWRGRTEKESAIQPWTSCASREGAKNRPRSESVHLHRDKLSFSVTVATIIRGGQNKIILLVPHVCRQGTKVINQRAGR